MSKYNFKKDFGRGRVGEKTVIKLLENLSIKCEENKNKLSDWDISLEYENHKITAEIKRDWMESKTKNIAIEYHNPKLNKPSGLMITKADLWFIVLNKPDRVYCTTVNNLKEYCSQNKPKRDIKIGGDDNASLWLYPSEEILTACFIDVTSANLDIILEMIKGLYDKK